LRRVSRKRKLVKSERGKTKKNRKSGSLFSVSFLLREYRRESLSKNDIGMYYQEVILQAI
jgi:hypothetical protein